MSFCVNSLNITSPFLFHYSLLSKVEMPENTNDEVRIYPPRLSAVRKRTPQSLYIIYSITINYASPYNYFFTYKFSFANLPLIPVATILLYIGNGNSLYKLLIHPAYSLRKFISVLFGY